ncbi:MAG: tyrosine--tRNA ligase [Saprospiraceae bacterium]|nr:tyrosine--tRNA ligase [Saprospiraceae bacterium]
MDFIEELKWRNMLHDLTPGAAERLGEGRARGYIGFDPTAPSMTIGNYVQIMLLKLFQLSGHQPIVLMGGATGRVGDPSGKDKERELKSPEELDRNLRFQQEQMKKFLDFDGENAAVIVNNLDFYKEMNVLDFLRNVGKTLTVNYMMSKDSVKNRLDTGLSFTEFSYQLLQAYDFQVLYSKHDCEFQMGGSDQWGNITSGTEFIRRNVEGKAYAVTTPLLTKVDGKKFGKSEDGNIWLDPNMTSPYKFYQFWINADDADIPTFMRYFTLKSKEEVLALEEQYAEDPRGLKAILAEEITSRVHSPEACESVKQVSKLLFDRKFNKTDFESLNADTFDLLSGEIPYNTLTSDQFSPNTNIIEFLLLSGDFASKSEIRNLIKGKALSLNFCKVESVEQTVGDFEVLVNRYYYLQKGKKNKRIMAISNSQ